MGDTFRNVKILVTGASGFIGSHIAARMVMEGARVSVLIREESDLWRLDDLKDDFDIYRVDLRDKARLGECIKKVRPDYIFHMGAYGVDARQHDYLTAAHTNIIGTMNLLDALIETGCEKFLNIGTCMEYGDKKEIIPEGATLEPFNIYGSTKAAATLIAHQIAAEKGIDVVTLRAFGIFGENEGSHKFFPHIILSVLQGREVNLTACEQYRDYCYIDNLIDGFLMAALNSSVKNEVFNIGSGTIHKLSYYVDMVYEQMKPAKSPNYGAIPYRPGEVWRPQPDVSKIKKMLNWRPLISFEEGLKRTIAWYDQNLDKYQGTGR